MIRNVIIITILIPKKEYYKYTHIFIFKPKKFSDRKSTRLNSSHLVISYAVFCLKKKKKKTNRYIAYLRQVGFKATDRSTATLSRCNFTGVASAWMKSPMMTQVTMALLA